MQMTDLILNGDYTILLGLDENQKEQIKPFLSGKRDELLPVHHSSLISHIPSTHQWYEWLGKKSSKFGRIQGSLYEYYVVAFEQGTREGLTSCHFIRFLQQWVQQCKDIYLYICDVTQGKRKIKANERKQLSLKNFMTHINEEPFLIRYYVLYHLTV